MRLHRYDQSKISLKYVKNTILIFYVRHYRFLFGTYGTKLDKFLWQIIKMFLNEKKLNSQ